MAYKRQKYAHKKKPSRGRKSRKATRISKYGGSRGGIRL